MFGVPIPKSCNVVLEREESFKVDVTMSSDKLLVSSVGLFRITNIRSVELFQFEYVVGKWFNKND